MKPLRTFLLGAGVVCLVHCNGVALACAACYGKSDSPMAQGMNAGICALLAVIGTVLSGAATFFVVLARRASNFAKTQEDSPVR